MNNVLFFHVATIGNYQQIVDRVFSLLEVSGLYTDLHRIFVNIAGDKDVRIDLKDKKIKLFPKRSSLDNFEFSTLCYLRQYAFMKEANLLYIHTKGCSTPSNPCIDEWREYMLYFNIIQYKKALKFLSNNAAVGVDLVDEPTKHFSGNFWWSKSSHIRALSSIEDQPLIISDRHKCEFWICSRKDSKYASMHDSGINVYSRHLIRYPKSNYENNN